MIKNLEDNGVNALVGIHHRTRMKDFLTKVVNELSELHAVKFYDVDVMIEGYESFLKYSTKMRATTIKEKKSVQEHKIYKGWFKVNNENLV